MPNLTSRDASRRIVALRDDRLPLSHVPIAERYTPDEGAERQALAAGLLAAAAAIPPKYFYDRLGCALFGAICEVPEYYPTRTERAIFTTYRHEIAQRIGRHTQFVDLGAGDCAKGAAWIDALEPARYVAVDIARSAIEPALERLAGTHPGVAFAGVVTDFTAGLELRPDLDPGPVTFFYPGSSIGNFDPADARTFLAAIRRHCDGRAGSGLLIGVDTRKDPDRLVAAYDDALGVTAAFNRNVLNHVNAVLGTSFDPSAFIHRARYDEAVGRIEMHLEADSRQEVAVAGRTRVFVPGERIHTENSYKYAPAAFAQMLRDAGFGHVRCWQDAAGDFAVFHAH